MFPSETPEQVSGLSPPPDPLSKQSHQSQQALSFAINNIPRSCEQFIIASLRQASDLDAKRLSHCRVSQLCLSDQSSRQCFCPLREPQQRVAIYVSVFSPLTRHFNPAEAAESVMELSLQHTGRPPSNKKRGRNVGCGT